MPSPGVEPGLPKPQSGVLPLYYKGLHYWEIGKWSNEMKNGCELVECGKLDRNEIRDGVEMKIV